MTHDLGENAARGIHDAVAAWLFPRLPSGRVLDIPSGEGAFARRCAARGLQAVAADCDALNRAAGVEPVIADMNRPLPFRDGEFDAVVSIEGIEHIERPFDFVRECRRVLKPGGLLAITTPNISALRSRWRWLLTGFHNKCKTPLDETAPNPLHHINMISFPELRYMLHTSGCRITGVTTNRCKAAAWLFAPLVPFTWLASRLVVQKEERDPAQRARSREVVATMHRRELLFGEIMIVLAEKPAG